VERKGEELLGSIQGMYFKIMGWRAGSLKELWRWLKGVGSTYSRLRKWRVRWSCEWPSTVVSLQEALGEVRGLIE
jgi:hypothetical protein